MGHPWWPVAVRHPWNSCSPPPRFLSDTFRRLFCCVGPAKTFRGPKYLEVSRKEKKTVEPWITVGPHPSSTLGSSPLPLPLKSPWGTRRVDGALASHRWGHHSPSLAHKVPLRELSEVEKARRSAGGEQMVVMLVVGVVVACCGRCGLGRRDARCRVR